MSDYIKGIDELNHALDNLTDTVQTNKNYLVVAGYTLLGESQKNAPVDTGFMRNSGYVKEELDSVLMGFSAEYAYYVHEGHHSWDGNPFISKAIFEKMDLIVDNAKRQLENDLGV
jgi:hypothetical protein